MATQYPGTLDSFATSAGTSLLTSPDHSDRHNTEGSAIIAVETLLGTASGSNYLGTVKAVSTQLGTYVVNATPTANNIPVLDANAKLPVAAVPVPTWTAVLGGVGFANSWINYGSSFATAAFYIDAMNVVHLKGFVKNGTVNTTVFTLPVGYRPQENYVFPQINNDAFGEIRVTTDGQVTQFITSTSSNSWLSLCGIEFPIF
jgi:hypothetical protein